MEKSSEVPSIAGLTLRSLVIGVAFVILWSIILPYAEWEANSPLMGNFVDSAPPYQFLDYPTQQFLFRMSPFIILSLVVAALPKRIRLTTAEMAFLYAMLGPMFVIPMTRPGLSKLLGVWANFKSVGTPDLSEFISPLVSPADATYAVNLLAGGTSIPWDAWSLPVSFTIVWCLALYYFMLFGSSIMSRIWIDVEALSFPLAQVISEGIKERGERRPVYGSKFLLIGLLIGFLSKFAITIPAYYPPLENPPPPGIDLWPYGIPATVVWSPWWYALGLLVPLDVSTTASIGYIVWALGIFSLAVSVGAANPVPLGNTLKGATYGAVIVTNWITVGGGVMPFFQAVLFMMVLYPVFMRRHEVILSLKMALNPGLDERADRLPHRLLWLGWAVTGLVFLGCLLALGIGFQYAIGYFFVTALYYWGMARLTAEGGGYMASDTHLAHWRITPPSYLTHVHDLLTGGASSGLLATQLVYVTPFVMGGSAGVGTVNPTTWFMSSYKVGDTARVRWRELFTANIIGITLATVIVITYTLSLRHTYGISVIRGLVVGSPFNWARRFWELAMAGQYGHYAQMDWNEASYVVFLFGIALTILLYEGRARFGGRAGSIFRTLSPAGLMTALIGGPILWFPFLVAMIVKRILLRVAGVRVFEEQLNPLCAGIIMGAAITPVTRAISTYLQRVGYVWW